MFKNIGKTDRIIRVILGLSLMILSVLIGSGILGFVVALFGIVFFVTGVVGWCGLYTLVGFSSKGQGVDKITRNDIKRAVREHKVEVEKKPVVKKSVAKKKVEKKPVVKKSTVVKKSSTKKVVKKKPVVKKSNK